MDKLTGLDREIFTERDRNIEAAPKALRRARQ
jgi:hypothetical protein